MPTPNPGESRDDFINRCMGDAEANASFPDAPQRFQFCRSQWDRRDQVTLAGKVLKLNEDQRLVYGWASVTEVGGKPVVDLQGDTISDATLLKAAHGFMLDSREGEVLHDGKRVADIVDSMVFTKDLQAALGVDLGKVGWLIGMKIRDESMWKRIKTTGVVGFSIGGLGRRVEL